MLIRKGEDFEDKSKVACKCQKPPGRGQLIHCSKCNGWFHFKCVRMTTKEAEKLSEYICESCSVNGNADEIESGEEQEDINVTMDPTRLTVISGFKGIFGNHKELLAKRIEQAMHETLKDQGEYRAKYRSLLLNLKNNPALKEAMIQSQISAQQLVTMMPQDLANEKIKGTLDRLKEASQRDLTMIEESGVTSMLFKPLSTPSIGLRPTTPPTPLEYPVFSNVQPKPVKPNEIIQDNSPAVVKDLPIAKSTTKKDSKNVIWKGQIVCAGLGYFPAQATYLESDRGLPLRELKSLLPHHLHVVGRLDVPKGRQYLETLLDDPNRYLNFILVTPQPSANADDLQFFAQLQQQCEEKIAVLIVDQLKMKDFYLMSVEDGEQLSLLKISHHLNGTESENEEGGDASALALIGVIVPIRK